MKSFTLSAETAVTSIAVAGPKIINDASDIPNITDTFPVLGRGAFKLSEVKKRIPKINSPNNEVFLYLMRI